MNKLLLAACVSTLAFSSAHAAELVTNGNFETTTAGTGQMGYNTQATGWTTRGYNFLFYGNTADSAGARGRYGYLPLWGPSSPYGGSNNGYVASPDGGYFVGADGAFGVDPISQTITGLVAGAKYKLSFQWAGIQQAGYNGAQTEAWEVSLGNETYKTPVYNNPQHGFSGWMKQSFTFTATGPTEVLKFIARGTPDGVPPFSLLDGVSLTSAVPEPATWAMMVLGFGVIGGAMRRGGRRSALAMA